MISIYEPSPDLPAEKSGEINVFSRRMARVASVQGVYLSLVCDDLSPEDIVYDIITAYENEILYIPGSNTDPDGEYFFKLIDGTLKDKDALLKMIGASLSEGWTTSRLALVLLSILLVGSYELKSSHDTPNAVIINEYIEIAKLFNHNNDAGFINSVLDNISKQYCHDGAL